MLVAGDGADNIGKQSGGWTLSWQGTGNRNEHFPNATSIYAGIKETLEANGGSASLSETGEWTVKPDVAIVVFGEEPYAEGGGDPRFDFTGRLSFSWPATAGQAEVNIGDSDYAPLFPYTYGLGYADITTVPQLSEDPALSDDEIDRSVELITMGKAVGAWRMILRDTDGQAIVTDVRGASPSGQLEVVPADNRIQEDTFVATWKGSASLVVEGAPVNFQQQASEDQALQIIYRVISADLGKASLAMGEGALDVTADLNAKSGKGWQTANISLSCFADLSAQMGSVIEPIIITAEGLLKLQITSVKLTVPGEIGDCDM